MQDTFAVAVEQRGEDGLLHHRRKRLVDGVGDEASRFLEEPVNDRTASNGAGCGRVAAGTLRYPAEDEKAGQRSRGKNACGLHELYPPGRRSLVYSLARPGLK